METRHSTVPGAGVLHDEIFVYDSAEPDRVVAQIVLEEDEADQVAELLHSQPITDRIAELERRVARLTGS